MAAFLRILGVKPAPEPFVLPTDQPILVGRGEGCDLRIDHHSLSRLHCVLEFEIGSWRVADCRSTNGTRVAGFKIAEAFVWPGEAIEIGEVRLEFDVQDPAELSSNSNRFPLAGRHFGRFELLRRVHNGTSGIVYLARETEKNRQVALKVLTSDWVTDETLRKRFSRGVRAGAGLRQPNVVQLYATGKTDGQAWLSMEWVDGPSVRELIEREQRLSPAESVRIIRDLAHVIGANARAGIVHRNIKPSSILLSANGVPKLGDFMLARRVSSESENPITQTGEIVGDSEYLAPECFRDSSEADCRADIYSLGVCLFTMLTGKPPFREPNVSRLMQRVLHDPIPLLSEIQPEIPKQLDAIVAKCLAKDRADRFQTPEALAHALAEVGDVIPTPVPSVRAATRSTESPTILDAPPELTPSGIGSGPVSLPSTPSREPARRRFQASSLNAPAKRPLQTLLVTVAIVVGVGSLVMFADQLPLDRFYGDSRGPAAPSGGPVMPPDITAGRPRAPEVRPGDTPDASSKPLEKALADPKRLIVQPGTTLRSISEAIDAARDGQVIEVASNEAFRAETKLVGKSVTLVANPEFRPTLRNTLRINGGGTIRIEGFHFEPYVSSKPAIEIEKMPRTLEIVGCTFRGGDGVLIAVRSTTSSQRRPQLLVERSFAAGNIVFDFTGLPPNLRVQHTLMVVDQSVLEWRLVPTEIREEAAWSVHMRNNTLVGRNIFHIGLNDQQRAIDPMPQASLRLDDNIFAFPPRYVGSFFRWEAWQRADIAQGRFVWSGGNNAFAGPGSWSIASTLVLSDPASTPQVVIETPEDWEKTWAKQIGRNFKVPPEFRSAGTPKATAEFVPGDFELDPKSKLREMGTDKTSLGADVRALPTPPARL
jgi:serine/threonine protein kinase